MNICLGGPDVICVCDARIPVHGQVTRATEIKLGSRSQVHVNVGAESVCIVTDVLGVRAGMVHFIGLIFRIDRQRQEIFRSLGSSLRTHIVGPLP